LYVPFDLVKLDWALDLFFFAVSVLVPIPNQCNIACDPANIIVSGVASDVVVVQVLLL
jgi:hypothetical protein